MNKTVTTVNAGARLDRLPASRFHRRLVMLIGGGMFFDGFDLFLAANVLGALTSSGFSTLHLNGLFASATFAGMTLGALFSGWVGDRFGRRITYQINLLIFGGGSVIAAVAPDMYWLIGARFIMGLGLGAEIVVGYATFAEFLPPAVRGRWLGILGMPMQIALFLGSLIGLVIIPTLGWRVMFWITAVGAGVIWYLRKNIPESPRWLEQQGRLGEADAIIRDIEEQSGYFDDGRDAHPAASPAVPTSFANRHLQVRLFVGSITLIVLNITVFGFLTFIPSFFVSSGLGVVKSLGFSTIMTLGGPVGGLIALASSDKIGRKKLLVWSAIVTAAIGCFYPFVGQGYLITGVGFLLVTALYVNSTTAYSMFIPELFPTDVRLRCVGFCHTCGRIAGAIAPLIVVVLYASHGVGGVVGLMVGALVIQAAVVWIFAVEPKFQSLESLSLGAAETGTVAVVKPEYPGH